MKKKLICLLLSLVLALGLLPGCQIEVTLPDLEETQYVPQKQESNDLTPEFIPGEEILDLSSLPPYSGEPFVAVNGNVPFFEEGEITDESFEAYRDLDDLGRCTSTVASIGKDLMPTEKRGSISEVHPSGWVQAEYDWVDGKALYNRCHLIGFQLTGENANWENLITGTRYLNVQGMLPFENLVADYVKETGNHVMYRVTPVYTGNNLVADGVLMEALSVEDGGAGVQFCVYCYNVQPGVEIDYTTGRSRAVPFEEAVEDLGEEQTYILNTSSHKFHLPDCSGAVNMNPDNRQEFTGSRETLLAQGYAPCGSCKP